MKKSVFVVLALLALLGVGPARAQDHSVTLQATQPVIPDDALSYTNVYRDGQIVSAIIPVPQPGPFTYTDSSVLGGQTYDYALTNIDVAGLESPFSNLVIAAIPPDPGSPVPAPAATTAIFIGQAAAGTGDGSSCMNSKAASFFNSGSNWGSSANQIGPGTFVHLCGKVATTLVAQGNGTSGFPVTIVFEPGASISEPACPAGGCLVLDGRTFVVVDGQTTGIVEATANGSTLSIQQPSRGISADPCNNCEIKNLTIQNIYVHSSASDGAIDQNQLNCIWFSGSNSSIHDNTMHDAAFCLDHYWEGGDTGDSFFNNNIFNVDHGIVVNGFGTKAASHEKVYGNHIHDLANWDTTSDSYHHDGIHAYGTSGATITDLEVFDNQFDGSTGVNFTSWIYAEKADDTAALLEMLIFGNIVDGTKAPQDTFGLIGLGSIDAQVYSNTIIGINGKGNNYCVLLETGAGVILRDNLMSGCQDFIFEYSGSLGQATLNNNIYANPGSCPFGVTGGACSVFAKWQAGGQDAASQQITSANLGSNYVPNAGATEIGAVSNLSSLNITGLNLDFAGHARPLTANWTAGALEPGTGTTPPPPAVPVITSPLKGTWAAGAAFTYPITASGSPTSFTASGLPAGCLLNATSGVISCTNTVAGVSMVIVGAVNAAGTGNATLTWTITTQTLVVTVAPPTNAVTVNGSIQFGATVSGSANTAVTWSAVSGKITAAGLYTAPATAGTDTVAATSAADGITKGTATVTVNAATTTMFPYTLGFTVPTLNFTYTQGGATPAAQSTTVWDSSPCPPPAGVPTCHWPVTMQSDSPWLIASPASGTTSQLITVTINPAGFAVGKSTGHVKVTSPQLNGSPQTLTVNITVAAGSTAVSVAVAPKTATVPSSGTATFTAAVLGSTNTAVSWTATLGSVSSTGVYTAPFTLVQETDTITATSKADGTKSDTATVTVTPTVLGALQMTCTVSASTNTSATATCAITNWPKGQALPLQLNAPNGPTATVTH